MSENLLPGRMGKLLPWQVQKHKYHSHIHVIRFGSWEYQFTPRSELSAFNHNQCMDPHMIHGKKASFVEADRIVREHAATQLKEALELFERFTQEERWIPASYEIAEGS